MGSFLLKCNLTKNTLKEDSNVVMCIFLQKITPHQGKISLKEPLFTRGKEKIPLFYAQGTMEDYGRVQYQDGQDEVLFNLLTSLHHNFCNLDHTYQIENLNDLHAGNSKPVYSGGVNKVLTNNKDDLIYMDRYPINKILDFFKKYPATETTKAKVDFIKNINHIINEQTNIVKLNGEFYLLCSSLYSATSFNKALKLPMKENGITYKNAKEYIKAQKQQGVKEFYPVGKTCEEQSYNQYIGMLYLIKLGIPTDSTKYAGQDYSNDSGKQYKKYVTLTK